MCTIVFSQLNMWASLHKAACLVIPKLYRHSWTLISHRSEHRTQIGVRKLLKIGMQNPEIIRNNSKNDKYNSDIIVI